MKELAAATQNRYAPNSYAMLLSYDNRQGVDRFIVTVLPSPQSMPTGLVLMIGDRYSLAKLPIKRLLRQSGVQQLVSGRTYACRGRIEPMRDGSYRVELDMGAEVLTLIYFPPAVIG